MSDRMTLHVILERKKDGTIDVVEASTSEWKTDNAYTREVKNLDRGSTLHKAQLTVPSNTFELLAPAPSRNVIDLN